MYHRTDFSFCESRSFHFYRKGKIIHISVIIKVKNLRMKTYTSLQIIGEGSFGSVYLIRDDKERLYALKKIHVDPFEIEQALQEIKIMQEFVHPNLVKIYSHHFDQNTNILEIIMEYCQEGDLLNYFKKKQKDLSVSEVIRFFRQIVQAFIVMNVKGVFHRDLKPENILIGKGMVIKVADFGCSKSVNKTEISKIENHSLDKGTPIYASPQQLRNEKYSYKCDIWSAGCLLFFIYFGYHPFMDSRAHGTLSLIKKLTEGKKIELEQNTHPTIAKLISLCLIYEDKERASWRELWLSRLFVEKVSNIKGFVQYLKNVTIVANWIAKEFWRIRKEFVITQNKEEVFVYFIIKFQYSNLNMALNILKKSQKFRYLFDEAAFRDYQPSEQQFNDIKRSYVEHQKYYNSILKSLQSKQAYKAILQRQPQRTSAFSDLDNSIRAGYKTLLEIKDKLDTTPKRQLKIWVVLSRWINFQKWFSYEKEPRVEKIISQAVTNPFQQVKEEISRYQLGLVQ